MASSLNHLWLTAQDLGKAAAAGDAVRVQEILDYGIDVDAIVNNDGETAIIQAIRWGRLHVVDTLLAAGANVNLDPFFNITTNDAWEIRTRWPTWSANAISRL